MTKHCYALKQIKSYLINALESTGMFQIKSELKVMKNKCWIWLTICRPNQLYFCPRAQPGTCMYSWKDGRKDVFLQSTSSGWILITWAESNVKIMVFDLQRSNKAVPIFLIKRSCLIMVIFSVWMLRGVNQS